MATTSSFVIPWGMSVVWHSPYWHLLEEDKVSLQYAREMSPINAYLFLLFILELPHCLTNSIPMLFITWSTYVG